MVALEAHTDFGAPLSARGLGKPLLHLVSRLLEQLMCASRRIGAKQKTLMVTCVIRG